MRKVLGTLIAVVVLAGALSARAAESGDGPASAGPLGDLWFADPTNPYAPAGAIATATYEAPEALADPDVATKIPHDLPDGIPSVARRPEPVLPDAAGWVFGDRFPRTSGTGRLAEGALFWSDFLYDDNGAVGVPPADMESTGAPVIGTYRYPEPDAFLNGADIFRVGLGVSGNDTVWRVDWNTLVDPDLPIAMFTIDADPATGVDEWPANARVRSPGIDHAVVLSAAGGRVLDLVRNTEVAVPVRVDAEARSFVLRTSAVPTDGSAVLRVAAGLSDGAGAFLELAQEHGAIPGVQPNVFNVAFRDYEDEPAVDNTWFDVGQTQALTAGGDVSAFSATVAWSDLDRKVETPEVLLPGFTNRWYVSSIELGQGMAKGEGISLNGPVGYRGRVQPYAIYVPTTYSHDQPSALTWLLHGSSSSHNSAQVHPRFLESGCERLDTICVSPLGRGPSGNWEDEAELDFWEVWNRVASTYSLDPDRTVLSGISMGAYGTYSIAMNHPEAFAAAVAIVGHADEEEAGIDRLTNLRWIPIYARHGTLDQLVPFTDELATQTALREAGLRHVFDHQLVEDHVVVALKDAYDDVASYIAGVQRRQANPPRLDYAWDVPSTLARSYGIERTGTWWLDGVRAAAAGTRARISARSFAIPEQPYDVVERDEPRVLASPSPSLRHILEWVPQEVALPEARPELVASLSGVAALTIDLRGAGLGAGAATLTFTRTDALSTPTALGLDGLAGRTVRLDGVVTSLPLRLTGASHTVTIG